MHTDVDDHLLSKLKLLLWGPILFLLFVLSPGPIAARELSDLRGFCDGINVRVSFPADPVVAAAQDARFTSDTSGSSASIVFQNRSQKPIIEVMAVIEYFDATGRWILSLVFHAATLQAQESLMAPIESSTQDDLFEPVAPGASFPFGAYSPFITTLCPSEGRTTLVFIRYSDETTYFLSSSVWRGEPRIRNAPQYFDMHSAPFIAPVDCLFGTKIDGSGHVARLQPLDPACFSLVDWLLTRLSKWQFVAAIIGGESTASEFVVLVRFRNEFKFDDNSDWFQRNADDLPQKLAVVNVVPCLGKKDKWVAYFGIIRASKMAPSAE